MALSLLVAASFLILAVALADRRWRRATAAAVAGLRGAEAPHRQESAAQAWDGLPEPVRRYLEFALGSPAVRPLAAARFEQQGSFAVKPEAWKPFTAVQSYRVRPAGFVWDARISFFPRLTVRVRDGYGAGQGRTEASLLGILPIAAASGGGELATASLQRLLAELPWLPTALQPSAWLSWTAIDARHARATLLDGELSATVDFEFGEQGEIAGVSALRSRTVGRDLVPTPWEGRFWDYRETGGLKLPHRAEVAWILPAGRHTYWRAEILRCDLWRDRQADPAWSAGGGRPRMLERPEAQGEAPSRSASAFRASSAPAVEVSFPLERTRLAKT